MLTRPKFDSEDLALAIVLWICSLPLIVLIVTPAFGLKIAALTAMVFVGPFHSCLLGNFSPAIVPRQAAKRLICSPKG